MPGVTDNSALFSIVSGPFAPYTFVFLCAGLLLRHELSTCSAALGPKLKNINAHKRQFIKGRLVASCPIAILRHIELLMLVILYSGTLIAPAVTLSVGAAWFHKDRIPSHSLACHIVVSARISN